MIREMRLRNFKSFRDSTLRFGPFTLIIGANGSGKSNLFDALRFLHFVGEGSSVRDAIEGHVASSPSVLTVPGIRGGSRALTHMGSESNEFSLELKFGSGSTRISYSLSVDCTTYRVVAEELKSSAYGGPYVFSTHPETNPLKQDPESPALEARFYKRTKGPNPRRQFSPHSTILSQFKGRAAESTANESVAAHVRNELASIRPLELRPEVLRGYSALGQFELGEHGENFAALVWMLLRQSTWRRDDEASRDAARRLDAIRGWLSELTPHTITSIETEDAPTGEVIFAVREEPFEQPLTARSLSDGTLRFAALTFAVLGSSHPRTLLIEELENGINPARQALLVRMLEEATSTRVGTQVLASTHGPGVLDFASESALADALVIGWDHHGQSSRVVSLRSLPGFDEVREKTRLGELQTEGWFQFAADEA